jgi:hypothetical protein
MSTVCLLCARHPIVHQLFPRLVECHDLLVNLGDDIRDNISEFARASRPQSSYRAASRWAFA